MPRPKNNSLLALFKCNSFNQIVCYNGKCNGKALCKHSANLERHLKLIHPYIYNSYIKKKKIVKFPRKVNFEKRLIDAMRCYPILWDKLNEEHFNEDLRNNAWKEISYHLEVTVHKCKKKWDILIDKFRCELNQTSQSVPVDEANTDVNYSTCKWNSKWKYFSELLFLHDQIDLTKSIANILPDQTENIKLDNIKEESSESYALYNQTLEDSSQLEFGEESIVQDDRDDSRLINETEIRNMRVHDDKEASGLLSDASQESKLQYDGTQNGVKQSRRKPELYETDSEDDHLAEKTLKKKRKKIKYVAGSDSESENEPDTDRMFLLSLLPFMKSIPKRKKLFVRHRIQGVLLEEQPNS